MDIVHTYKFIEHDVDLFETSAFLNDLEKLCLQHKVTFDHINVHHVTDGNIFCRKEICDGRKKANV